MSFINTPAQRARRKRMQQAIRDGQQTHGEHYLDGATSLTERMRRLRVLQHRHEREGNKRMNKNATH